MRKHLFENRITALLGTRTCEIRPLKAVMRSIERSNRFISADEDFDQKYTMEPNVRLFFEITTGNIERYNRNFFSFSCDDYFLVYDTENDQSQLISEISNKVYSFRGWDGKNLKRFLKYHKIQEVIVNSFRMTDVSLINICRNLDIPVIYNQHGQYDTYIKRDVRFFLKFRKAMCFFKLYFTSVQLSPASLSYPAALLGICSRKHFRQHICVNKAIFWSKYWEHWHDTNHWCYWKFSHIIGNPNVNNIHYRYEPNARTALIISQSLVEDGRLSLNRFYKKFIGLNESLRARSYRVIVRIHPRQSKEVIEFFKGLGWIIDEGEGQFVVSNCIGSYSSVLPSIAAQNIPITLVNFDNTELEVHFRCLDPNYKKAKPEFVLNNNGIDLQALNWYWGI